MERKFYLTNSEERIFKEIFIELEKLHYELSESLGIHLAIKKIEKIYNKFDKFNKK